MTARRDWTNLRAVSLVLGAVGIFSLIFIVGRFTGELASPLQIMFLRYVGGFFTVLVIAVLMGESWRSLQSANRANQAARALAGGLGGAAIIYGNANMPLVDANAIGLLSGVFMLWLGIAVLGDRLRSVHVMASVVCIGGAVIVMLGRGAFANASAAYLVPAGVVTIGALLLAVEGIFIKILAMSDRPLVTLAHANAFGMLVLLVPAIATWKSTGPVNAALLFLGPFAILGQFLNIRGYMLASVSILAPVHYASLIFAALWGWLLFAEAPTSLVVLGAALIAGGGIVLALSRR